MIILLILILITIVVFFLRIERVIVKVGENILKHIEEGDTLDVFYPVYSKERVDDARKGLIIKNNLIDNAWREYDKLSDIESKEFYNNEEKEFKPSNELEYKMREYYNCKRDLAIAQKRFDIMIETNIGVFTGKTTIKKAFNVAVNKDFEVSDTWYTEFDPHLKSFDDYKMHMIKFFTDNKRQKEKEE